MFWREARESHVSSSCPEGNFGRASFYMDRLVFRHNKVLRPIVYFRFEINLWVWSPFCGHIGGEWRRAVHDIWKVKGGSLGEQVVFMKTHFLQQNLRENEKLDHVRQHNIQFHGTGNLDFACFRKVLKNRTFKRNFCFSEKGIFETTCFSEQRGGCFDARYSLKRAIHHTKRGIVHKTLPCFA